MWCASVLEELQKLIRSDQKLLNPLLEVVAGSNDAKIASLNSPERRLSLPDVDLQLALVGAIADSLPKTKGFEKTGQNDAEEAFQPLLWVLRCGVKIKSIISSPITQEIYTETPETPSIIQIPVKENFVQTFLEYFDPEDIAGYKPIIEKDPVRAQRQFEFTEPPETLTIQLKRFDHSKGYAKKNNTKIKIDLDKEMDLSKLLHSDSIEKTARYQLKGVVLHSGGVGGGHYWSLVKKPDSWYKCNDSFTNPVSEEAASDGINQSGYIFVWERVTS